MRSTSLAVLVHLKDVCYGNNSVSSFGFAGVMLLRVMDVSWMSKQKATADEINWAALGVLVSACLS